MDCFVLTSVDSCSFVLSSQLHVLTYTLVCLCLRFQTEAQARVWNDRKGRVACYQEKALPSDDFFKQTSDEFENSFKGLRTLKE